jgi:hypothetical protein
LAADEVVYADPEIYMPGGQIDFLMQPDAVVLLRRRVSTPKPTSA